MLRARAAGGRFTRQRDAFGDFEFLRPGGRAGRNFHGVAVGRLFDSGRHIGELNTLRLDDLSSNSRRRGTWSRHCQQQ